MGVARNARRNTQRTCRTSPRSRTRTVEKIQWPPVGSVQHGPYILAAGKYWLGDLCNVLSDLQWKEIASKNASRNGSMTLNDGRVVVTFKLPQGCGIYPGRDGHHHIVNSGTIGVTLLHGLPEKAHKMGQILTYNHEFSCASIVVAHPQGGGTVSFNSFGPMVEVDSDDHVNSMSQFIREGFAAAYH
jgi:hypothetical protein